jgi:pyroglutamyl-peptidase
VLPVDFERVKSILGEELAANYDFAVHLGQAPGSAKIQLEAIALNLACERGEQSARPLCDDGPLAYQSTLPLFQWAERIRAAGIPAEVSFHAGTYLCNAALYLTHYHIERRELKTRAAFIHLPLDPSQVISENRDCACLPAGLSAKAIRIVLDDLAANETLR